MKYEKEFRKAHPETIGETDRQFDESNYTDWLEKAYASQLPTQEERLTHGKVRKILDDWNVQPPKTQIAEIAPDSFTELQKSPHLFRAYLTEAICSLSPEQALQNQSNIQGMF